MTKRTGSSNAQPPRQRAGVVQRPAPVRTALKHRRWRGGSSRLHGLGRASLRSAGASQVTRHAGKVRTLNRSPWFKVRTFPKCRKRRRDDLTARRSRRSAGPRSRPAYPAPASNLPDPALTGRSIRSGSRQIITKRIAPYITDARARQDRTRPAPSITRHIRSPFLCRWTQDQYAACTASGHGTSTLLALPSSLSTAACLLP